VSGITPSLFLRFSKSLPGAEDIRALASGSKLLCVRGCVFLKSILAVSAGRASGDLRCGIFGRSGRCSRCSIAPFSAPRRSPTNARFAGTTFVLSMVNARVRGITVPNIVVGLAYGYGGLVQLIAGVEEWACGNVSRDYLSWQIGDCKTATPETIDRSSFPGSACESRFPPSSSPPQAPGSSPPLEWSLLN